MVVVGGLPRRPEDGTGEDHDAGPRKWSKGEEGKSQRAKEKKHGERAKEKPRRRRKPRGALSLSLTDTLFSFLPPHQTNPPTLQQPKVDVDFFGPIILTAKREAVRAWRKLPPPAQNASPYVATAAASGGSVFAWQRRRLLHERARGDLLATRVESLSAERVRLQDACKALRAAAATPRAAADVRSAEAVAAATAAAAAAASAAAEAAKACAVYVTRGGGGGGGPPRRTPEN